MELNVHYSRGEESGNRIWINNETTWKDIQALIEFGYEITIKQGVSFPINAELEELLTTKI